MIKTLETLTNLGLEENEAKVYLVCLNLGPSSVLNIAREVKIPRTTVYLILDSLISKKLIEKTVKGKKKRFSAAPPEYFIGLLEKKEKKLSLAKKKLLATLPLLQSLKAKPGRPKVRYYEGIEEIKDIYEDSLQAKEILVFCLCQEAYEIMPEYIDKYCTRVIRRMIKTKEIVSDSKADKEYQRKFSTPRNIIKCIPKKFITSTDKLIYGHKVAFISYVKGKMIGVIIEDEEITKHERKQFEFMWQQFKA